MTLPTLSQEIFLAVMVILQIADAWTTYDVIRAGGKEGNPVVSKLMGAFGLRGGLWIAKLAAIGYFIFWPVTDPTTQWFNVAMFAGVSLWNYNNLRKQRARVDTQ